MRKFFTDRTPPNAAQLASVYDAHASTWLQREARLETRLASEQWRDDFAAELKGDVLEIGVAAGDTLIRLSKYGHAVTSFTGIDTSPGMIEETRPLAVRLGVPTELHEASAEDLSMFPDASFDTVCASLVFCTIPDVPRALQEIKRVLRPEGRLVLLEHVLSPNRIVGQIQRLVAPPQIRYIGCHLDRETVVTLRQHRFQIETERRRIFGIMRFVIATPPA